METRQCSDQVSFNGSNAVPYIHLERKGLGQGGNDLISEGVARQVSVSTVDVMLRLRYKVTTFARAGKMGEEEAGRAPSCVRYLIQGKRTNLGRR